jgi:cell division protein ZapA (FtsZ GTPase activity inhibitor)
MQATLTILGRDYLIDCTEQEERRLQDLAKALEARLQAFGADADARRSLILTALALMDEAQTTNAALARAHCEIERLTDMVVEARLEAAQPAAATPERGRVGALRRVAEGAA